jgi:translocation and assembly module TamB
MTAGTLTGTATVNAGRWGSRLTATDIQLNQLAQTLRGTATGDFQLAGITDDFSLSAIQAQGNVALSAGLSALSTQLAGFDRPLTSTLAWDGRRILIEQARSEQLQVSGVVIPQINGYRVAGIEQFNLDLAAQNYPLASAPLPTPEAVNLGGFASFAGRLTGTPSAPNLTGSLTLNEFAVNHLAFEPILTGTVDYTQGALALAVAGGRDQIDVDFKNRQDFRFQVDWQEAFARGATSGDVLNATLGNFPLAVLQLPVRGPMGILRGTVSSPGLSVNLANQTLVGSIAIDQFGVGYIGIEQITGQIRYANNLATLIDGKVLFEESFYQVNGRLDLANDFAYAADIRTDQGKIQDLFTVLSIFEFSDLARGLKPPDWIENPIPPEAIPTILDTEPAGNPQASLLTQLRRLAEIQAIQDRDELAAEQAPVPPLRELDGPFAGTINLAGSRTAGVNVDFNLLGADWRWGDDYSAERVIARGEYGQGRLVLEPLRFESTLPIAVIDREIAESTASESGTAPEPVTDSGQAFIELAGQFILADRSDNTVSNLQLVAKNISVDRVRNILNLPLSLSGRLNGTATLSGTIGDPQVRGVARLVDATINRQPIESAQAQFLYQHARLSLLSSLQAEDNPEPLQLSAQIPYAFGFMTVQPASDQILLDINVKDEGLALLNIVNRQVTWESGQGTVSLSVRGTLQNPQIAGFANLQDTTVRSRILPEPVTNLNASARFTGDRIIVDQLTGQFSNGQITAAGTFPILFPIIRPADLAALGNPIPDGGTATETASPESEAPTLETVAASNSPLTVELDNIVLALKGIYDGQVDGRIVIGGSLLLGGPQLGGRLQLSQGQIFLPENTTTTGEATAVDVALVSETDRGGGLSITPRLQNLNLTLGRSVQVIQGNLLNFFADGSLQLNGPLTVLGLRPEGTIRLITGRVNLFTTSFRLAGGDNTATFSPELGLTDPILDINLRTSVAEVTRSGPTTATSFTSSEVADTSADPFRTATGSLQTVRIQARVNGPTSQIFNNLVLSSSPPRSQNEIIGLIGGSFVTALESGSSGDLSGVVNLFGGVLLNRIQDFVTSTLNLSEFRLFPVTSASRFSTRDNTGSTLDVGGEIGFDLSDSFTVSLLKILTDSTPTEFNLRYRLSDQFTIRTTTNLDDVNRVLLEFETRF